MIDINLIRESPALVKENIKKKFQNEKLPLVDKIVKSDKEWRELKGKVDSLRHERNKISIEISKEKKAGNSATQLLKQAKQIPKKIQDLEAKSNSLQDEIKKAMLQMPNIISKETPKGKDESQNKVIKKVGKIPKFKFKIKNHVELLESLDLADFDSSAKVSGNGFYYIKKDIALLNQALIRFATDFMQSRGFDYIETPLMLNEKSIYASMDKEAFQESVYSVKDENLNLIGTAEQSLLAMHSNQTLSESQLPKKYFSYSMCFRKEIGSHGINEKGLWRTHQFNKVEQFIFCHPDDSEKLYDELLKNSEDILKALKLPYQVLEICSGDLADWKYRSADLEIYRPTTKAYEEVMSLSNCTDYQARKINAKFSDKQGNRQVLHTLNDTALATSRILVAIIENNQLSDGTIKIPSILQKYMNSQKTIPSKK
ncbi:serine--tRNA ligase [Candidatus Pacearchaeota archaeon]|nr:serine--tRNA ligase [Candidatus Pacearchaeota archaeon]|tara:strand:+ start:696 stop:1979 length:1284 start_codon:yes stop_codon:yes gene_type:complete